MSVHNNFGGTVFNGDVKIFAGEGDVVYIDNSTKTRVEHEHKGTGTDIIIKDSDIQNSTFGVGSVHNNTQKKK